ncbi:phytase [Terricaulis silvestris]|uniref:3-phytase n=1 Tax=Terricaulis silvestris TaxID=2686094 RepID=A0A6I6MKQ0_9CAUL|nr:phytase [Terricaulis silvestris]QGZ93534.1 3-phytase precursor [Terricaulis silvestris]
MKQKRWAIGLFATAALAGCATSGVPEPAAPSPPALPSVAPLAETAPTVQSDANTAVLLPRGDGDGVIVGSSESGGIELYGLDGARISSIAAGAAVGIDARFGAPSANAWTVAALDGATNRLRLFEVDPQTGAGRERTVRDIPIGFAGESLCLYRDARDSTLYAFALGAGGEIAQYMISARGDGFDATLVRQLRVASEASYCAADDANGDLYVAEQGVGFWRFEADPEAEVVPRLIDAAHVGNITEEAGGIAVYNAGATTYVVASDASANRFHVYDRNADYRLVGSFALTPAGATDGVQAAGGLNATSFGYGARFPQGALLAMDDENDGGTNYKLVSWADIAGALNLATGTPRDPRVAPDSTIAIVHPSVETRPVETDGDAADDPAIWVDRNNPSRSIIIATQKQSGLYVYDLQGRVLQFLPDGRMNNVDVRDNFSLGGQTVSIATASNRTDDSISIYRIDAATRRLSDVSDGVQPTGFVDPYGLCMYQSAQSGKTYVFVTDSNGPLRQWELIDAGNGRIRAERVRDIPFATQTEGCVADDATGVLYVAEEDIGLWRVGAEPDAPATPVSVITVEANEALKDDLEGIGLYDLGGGRGYLVLSSQGNNTYAVFRREGNNDYVGSFAVLADAARGIDGISETDGLEVLSANLGGAYGNGIFIAQDGRNIAPQEFQNFKLVPWSAIAGALNLESR